MPTYKFENTKTGEVFEEFMKIEEKEKYLKKNPHIIALISGVCAFGDPIRLGIKRHDNGFKEVLQKIKQHHPRSNLDTK